MWRRRAGTSRPAAHFLRWKRRWEDEGLDGLKDRSSAPLHRPAMTHSEVVEKIIHLRRHYHFGPLKIEMYLRRHHDVEGEVVDRGVLVELPPALVGAAVDRRRGDPPAHPVNRSALAPRDRDPVPGLRASGGGVRGRCGSGTRRGAKCVRCRRCHGRPEVRQHLLHRYVEFHQPVGQCRRCSASSARQLPPGVRGGLRRRSPPTHVCQVTTLGQP
ncbi:helix-turn-helix domain-containing protein [Amycolatopsis sp. NPDC004368]